MLDSRHCWQLQPDWNLGSTKNWLHPEQRLASAHHCNLSAAPGIVEGIFDKQPHESKLLSKVYLRYMKPGLDAACKFFYSSTSKCLDSATTYDETSKQSKLATLECGLWLLEEHHESAEVYSDCLTVVSCFGLLTLSFEPSVNKGFDAAMGLSRRC